MYAKISKSFNSFEIRLLESLTILFSWNFEPITDSALETETKASKVQAIRNIFISNIINLIQSDYLNRIYNNIFWKGFKRNNKLSIRSLIFTLNNWNLF